MRYIGQVTSSFIVVLTIGIGYYDADETIWKLINAVARDDH